MENDTHDFTRYGEACVKDVITPTNQITNGMGEEAYPCVMNGIRTSTHSMPGRWLMDTETI